MKRTYNIFLFLLIISFACKGQDSFEFVVLPDTQTYVHEFPEIFMSQMQWIANEGSRFSFVLHEGDITQNNSEKEWAIARQGFALIDGKVHLHAVPW